MDKLTDRKARTTVLAAIAPFWLNILRNPLSIKTEKLEYRE